MADCLSHRRESLDVIEERRSKREGEGLLDCMDTICRNNPIKG